MKLTENAFWTRFRLDDEIRRAAEFSTDCKRFRRWTEIPASTAFPSSNLDNTRQDNSDCRTGPGTDWRMRVGWIIQPTRTPARNGRPRVRGRLVGRSVVSNFTRYSGAEIHSLGRRAFQAVGSAKCVCEHTSLTHLTTSTKYTCGLSTSAANGRDFTLCFHFHVILWYTNGNKLKHTPKCTA